jgi:signal transduction histidine kinase
MDELIDNSVKFSRPGSAITVDGRVENDFYITTVTDRGTGIKDLSANNIGLSNRQIDGDEMKEGVGTGLAIVNKILNLFGGNLKIKSKPGAGTTAEFKIPRAADNAYIN